ncbi:rCG63110 [Rattus norvegicus]|uniref:RCG63110 n=1 Tax=Rattus norvegicus TaxID=10116 RepID=A6K6P7_RAT|nr:rCG63110 [Rattus norvegicus]
MRVLLETLGGHFHHITYFLSRGI